MQDSIPWNKLREMLTEAENPSPISRAAQAAMRRFAHLTTLSTSTGTLSSQTLNSELDRIRRCYFVAGFKSLKPFQNWAALVRKGFREATGATRPPYFDEWRVLQDRIDETGFSGYQTAGFHTISKLAQGDEVPPSAVDDAWLAAKLKPMGGQQRTRTRNAVAHWNRLADAGLPVGRLNLPPAQRRGLTLPPAALPASLNKEIEDLIRGLHDPLDVKIDPVAALLGDLPTLDEIAKRHLSNSYILETKRLLYRVAGALVRSGTPAASIKTIRMLLTPSASALLAAELVRSRRVSHSAAAHVKLSMLMSIANRVGLGDQHINAMKEVRKSPHVLTKSVGRMGQSRQDLLEQFDAEDVIRRWLDLPRLLEKRGKERWIAGKHAQAIADLECASTADILQNSLVRIKNIRTATVTGEASNIIIPISSKDVVGLRWNKNETKNQRDIEVDLPPEASRRLLALLRSPYRKAIISLYGTTNSEFLFPGKTRSGVAAARTNIGAMFSERCTDFGIVVTPHLARGIAAEIIQKYGPNMMSSLHHILGNTEKVSEKFYTRPRTDLAIKRFHELIGQKVQSQARQGARIR